MKPKKHKQPNRRADNHIDRSDPSTRRLLGDIARCDRTETGESERLVPLARGGDDDARRRIIETNLRLVLRVAREMMNPCRDIRFDDMVMEGTIGLNDAIDHFTPKHGVMFCNYAAWWIRKRILDLLWDSMMLHFPDKTRRNFSVISMAIDRFLQERSRYPDDSELSEMTGLSMKTVKAYNQHLGVMQIMSIEQNELEINTLSGEVNKTSRDKCGDEGSDGKCSCTSVVCADYMPCVIETDFTEQIVF